ncbi:glycosyltransferase family 4 protein [Metabacillus fastidiosus]|uniref:glycosyltransferase family 4 protein n=1 Tax=Metabacillus fastidiosus TaxID=1458 RepID=UPI003D273EFC
MKILYVVTISNTVNAFLVPHIKFLIEQGNQVDVACNIVEAIHQDLLELGCKVHRVEFQRSPLKKENYIAYKQIRSLVRERGYELVHTHTPVASFLTRLACRNVSNIKMLYTAHGFHFYRGAPLKNWLIYYTMEKIVAKWTDGLITINDEDYAMARKMKLKRNDSIFKIHGVGINLEKFTCQTKGMKTRLRKELKYKEDDFILFYAAELNYNKHQDLLINTVNLLKNKVPKLKLLLAGDGELKGKYEEQVRKLGLQDNVEFLGLRSDIPDLMKISDIAVASSRREGLPVNVMEAMATGLPLVVTNSRGHSDLVINGENGYVVGQNDIKGFADSILELYKSQQKRCLFGEKGRNFVMPYTVERVKAELEEVYFKVIQ